MTITDGLDVVQRLLAEKPSFHLSGAARWDALPETLDAIRRSVARGDTTLEVGAGVSTVVFAASGAEHTVISPDPAEHELIRAFCSSAGIDDSRVTFVVGLSDDVLPQLLSRDRTLDVAFVDGAHSFPLPVTDWHYVARSLKVGGRLLMDDVAVPAAAQVFRYMKLEPGWRLDGIYDDRAAGFTLIAAPDPDDDWVRQPFNKGYPDFSFVPLSRRLQVESAWQARQLRRVVGERFPALRRIYKRAI